MSFLRICILFLTSLSCVCAAYGEGVVKPGLTKKPHVQTTKQSQPKEKKLPSKKGSVTHKPSSSRKGAPSTHNMKRSPAPAAAPAPSKIPAAVQKPAPNVSPVPSVVPKIPPTVAPQKKVAQAPQEKIKEQRLVVLDPGHGGYDLGAHMAACDEKSLALSTALLAKKYLTELGYRVILTRSRDIFMPLEQRTQIANETKGKLFASIHYNAAKNPIAKGVEVFYYVSADKFRTGASKKLAARVLSKIVDKTVAESRGIKEGNYYVIRETKMPAILIEAGFMTHPEELHLLKDINYRDKIARGIAEGIDSFFKT